MEEMFLLNLSVHETKLAMKSSPSGMLNRVSHEIVGKDYELQLKITSSDWCQTRTLTRY